MASISMCSVLPVGDTHLKSWNGLIQAKRKGCARGRKLPRRIATALPVDRREGRQQAARPRVNIAYLRSFHARTSFVNDARICGTDFWRDLTGARHLSRASFFPAKNWEI